MIGYNAQRYYYKDFSLKQLTFGDQLDTEPSGIKAFAEKINFVLGFNF
jgi:hypothetical protein